MRSEEDELNTRKILKAYGSIYNFLWKQNCELSLKFNMLQVRSGTQLRRCAINFVGFCSVNKMRQSDYNVV